MIIPGTTIRATRMRGMTIPITITITITLRMHTRP
jgi:hypothetical protein